MGTPEFAACTLSGIIMSGEKISLVVTQPDKPSGRGLRLIPSPVKILASSKGIPVLTPTKIRTKDFASNLSNFVPDLIIVSAYGRILPRQILEMPKLGCINVHASLLPKYRGAAPINWAIIRGEKKTGITIMSMNEGMDEGDIMFQREIPIDEVDDASSLHDKLAKLGQEAILEALSMLKQNQASFHPQNHGHATYAPILKKEDGIIDWNKSPIEVRDFIRGMNPWPGAFTYLDNKIIKIFKAILPEKNQAPQTNQIKPGEISIAKRNEMTVGTKNGSILIKELQMESRKRLPASEFLKGASGVISGKVLKNVQA